MAAGLVDAGKHIGMSDRRACLIDLDQGPADPEQGQRFARICDQRMDIARRLEQITPGGREPVAFGIVPLPLDHIAVDGRGVSVAADEAGGAHPHDIGPRAADRVEHQRPHPHPRYRRRHPFALIFRNGRGDDLGGGERMAGHLKCSNVAGGPRR